MSEYVEHAVWDLTDTEITVEVIVLFILRIEHTFEIMYAKSFRLLS